MDEHAQSSIVLPGRLDFAACEALAHALTERQGQNLTLDGANVQFVGGLAAEILCRARQEWDEAGHNLLLVNPSDDMADGLNLLGISPESFKSEPET